MLIDLIQRFIEEFFGGMPFKTILIIFASVIIFYLLFRGIYTWYWKINRIVKNQKIQNKLLADILTQLEKNK